MQITLNIDDEVLQAVQTLARDKRETVGELVTQMLRNCLAEMDAPDARLDQNDAREDVPLPYP